jgi:uncharacterized protein (DUF302 family)
MRGVIVTSSSQAFEATLASLKDAIAQRGLTLFAQIDHAGAARQAGLELADEQVLVFGNPRAGTALMQSDPRVGIELPLRMLVWQAGEQVMLGYLDPRSLTERYSLAGEEQTLAQMSALLAALAGEAAGTADASD